MNKMEEINKKCVKGDKITVFRLTYVLLHKR